MLHLRLRVPSELTETVSDRLCGDPTVTNVAVFPHGYLKPAGCLVMADVARESAQTVIADLEDLGVTRDGAIAIDDPRRC